MKKYLVCLSSVVTLSICKLFHWKKLQIGGIPVRIRIRNLDLVGGAIFVGRMINVSQGTKLISAKGGTLKIGDSVYFNRNNNVVCRGTIEIGNGCRFGPNVNIFDHDHEYGLEGVTDNYKIGNISIGNNCWCGANVTILRGSVIGDGCVIGAGVVFKGQVPPHSLVYNNKDILVVKQIN